MTVVQVWLVIGIPALVLALGLLVRGTLAAQLAAWAVLAAAFVAVVAVDQVSGLAFGALLVFLYAAGPGSGSPRKTSERQPPMVEDEGSENAPSEAAAAG